MERKPGWMRAFKLSGEVTVIIQRTRAGVRYAMSLAERRVLYSLLIGGSLFRLLYVLWVHPPESAVVSDMLAYRDVAVLEAHGSTEPFIAAWHCLSTHLLAFCFRYLGGPTPYAYLQCAAAIASLFLGARLARKALPPQLALVCIGLQAFDCITVSFAGNYMGETFAQLFFLLTLTLLDEWGERGGLALLVPSGLLLGLAGMSREYVLLSSVPIAFWVMIVHRGRLVQKLTAVAVLATCSVLVLSPHIARNVALTGEYNLGMSRGVRNLAYGWSRAKTQISLASQAAWCAPIYVDAPACLTAPFDFTEEIHKPATEDKAYWWAVLKTEVRQNPKIVVQKLMHPLYAWIIPAWPSRDSRGWMWGGVMVTHYLLLFVGLPLYFIQLGDSVRKERPTLLLLNLAVLGLWATTYLGHGQSSYRVPFQPAFWILALNGVSWIKGRRRNSITVALVTILGLSLTCWLMKAAPKRGILYPLSVVREVLCVAGRPVIAKGQLVFPLLSYLHPLMAEWSTQAYPHAWHYRAGDQRLRIDVDRNGVIESFHIQTAESPRYFPPDSFYRWNSPSKSAED